MKKLHGIVVLSVSIVLGSVLFSPCFAQTNQQLTFPKEYKQGVLYFKNDRGSITEDIYVDKEVIQKVQKKEAIPIGTKITLVEYFAKKQKGEDGYALHGDIKRFVVMQKQKLTSQNQKSGGWQYQAFNPDGSIKNEDLNRCVSCHDSQKNNDYVYTLDDMKRIDLKK